MNNGIQPTVELATNNGTYPYPVVYGNNGGFGNGGFFGGDGIWAIVLLALLFNNGGWGGFGGKGIKVCEEWKHREGFVNFYNWAINNDYSEKLTLDRIDNKKDYCPENCRWSTSKFQSNHKTNNVFYTFNGKTQTSKQWCDEYGLNQTTFIDRLKRGWTLEEALTISTKGNYKKVNRV